MYLDAPKPEDLQALADFLELGSVAVLTGAGLSTESGIPDYRGPEAYKRPRRPVQYQEFLKNAAARRRYWARSMLGWPRFARARPNAGHFALRDLEQRGLISGIVTQNVDSLHAAAGSETAVELHGALRDTICLDCGRLMPRDELQAELERLNDYLIHADVALAPDGDADLDDERLAAFRVVDCECGGRLKPHVVFFGENVPKPRVERALGLVAEARALLVVGSSLTVWSGYRFVRAAAERGQAVAIVGLGPTRGDADASLRVAGGAGVTLTGLCERLCAA
ncbi:MAG TPA: NAD-dependent protein deacetylase [Polyangiales bacterium]|nr:NAD-dependent protein deacetylase [Polyangiales bacterium]